MADLRPGQKLKEFRTRSGKTALLRVLRKDDVAELLKYINQLSSEDTFVAYSGEQLTLEQEEKFVKSSLNKFKKGDAIPIVCEIDGEIVSNSRLTRKTNMQKRSRHIAVVAISVKKEFRGEGIGLECMKELINQARNLKDIKILKLTAFAENQTAIHLYQKTGFKTVGRIPGQYLYKGKYMDSIVMQRDA